MSQKLSEKLKEAYLWAEKNLVGTSIYVSAIKKEVKFTKSGVKHALYFKKSIAKVHIMYDILSLIKNSKVLSIEKDKKGRKEIKKVYVLEATYKFRKKKYMVYIIAREVKGGVLHYDHGVIKEKN